MTFGRSADDGLGPSVRRDDRARHRPVRRERRALIAAERAGDQHVDLRNRVGRQPGHPCDEARVEVAVRDRRLSVHVARPAGVGGRHEVELGVRVLIPQLSLTVLPVLRPPCSVRPLRGRAVTFSRNPL